MVKTYKYPIILFCFFIVGCLVFHDYFASMFIDVPRELLIPKAMLEGKLLYKDILNIYGALPYFIALVFVKILGFKISTFFIMNAINALIFIYGIYFLSKQFVSKKYSCFIALSILFITVFNSSLFNFIFPYSICYTFGLCAYIYSTLFLIKFLKTKENPKFLYISLLFAGFALACKNEFIFLPLVFLLLFIVNFKEYKIKILYSLLLMGVFPLLQITILMLNGLSIQDLFSAYLIIKKSALTPAMIRFHCLIGMFPLFSIVKYLYPILSWLAIIISYFLFKKNKFYGYALFVVLCILINFYNVGKIMFFFLPIATFIWICCNIKKIFTSEKQALLVLGLCALFASLKNFYYLSLHTYGSYTAVLLLLLWVIILIYNKHTNIIKFFLIFSFIFFLTSCSIKIFQTEKVEFNGLKFSAKKKEIIAFDYINNWIEKNTKKDENIMIFPEGLIFHLDNKRKTDYMLYSLHDIFLETFDEEWLKKRIMDGNIKYIIDISDFSLNGKILHVATFKIRYLEKLLENKIKKIDTITVTIDGYDVNTYMYKKETSKL